jgi:hypothetical protein
MTAISLWERPIFRSIAVRAAGAVTMGKEA